MSFSYRIGKPFWKWFAKLGVTLRLRVGVGYDAEAKCYYVAWSDLPGINTDADTLEELNTKHCLVNQRIRAFSKNGEDIIRHDLLPELC